MSWQVGFSRRALKFLEASRFSEDDILDLLLNAIKRLQGEIVNVDIKKLKGKWAGFYRIRKGDLRVIASFDLGRLSVLVEAIDWRGGAYK